MTDLPKGWDIAHDGELADTAWIPWGSDGKARAKIAARADGYHIAVVEAEPGYRTDPHTHQHTEFFYLIEGTVSNQGHTISAGGLFAAAVGSEHNDFIAETKVKYLSIFKL
ncbi:cupin domain-containing protein [Actinacidiphila sp. ITFR-21]|uniref:cupin domain-containing protein n=1 Tax=Actinacidiphila sp. ITFR-21 TaxID=3075199 RepID=UPI00288A5117|nr:cupin domain-containing protein [Streptomyces sp. ITFR-21]WNI16400.1 cupin domain-containing protein [Streptomyces sp. ITFR-21]